MVNYKVLVVDDEPGIRDVIKEYMGVSGFEITESEDGISALNKLYKSEYDLVILDVMMPKMDGWSLCREIRKTSSVPVIMLTARGEEYDKLLGFELGVDDYIVKPFSPKELVARAKAVLNRTRPERNVEVIKTMITYGKLNVDLDGRNVTLGDHKLQLTPKEFDVLSFLVQNPNKAFSREQLLTSVWGFDFYGDDRTVDTHIKMIREHLGEYRTWIVTVWGIGYKFEPQK
ncbi:MAG: response regulator transcription factor [Clostridia bacterium]|nr:response regulator transcription factor [Clostridia bacterium]